MNVTKDNQLELKAKLVSMAALSLKNFGDFTTIAMWDGYSSHADVVRTFWPVLAPKFDEEPLSFKDIKAEVIYFSNKHDTENFFYDPTNHSIVEATGMRVEYITLSEANNIRLETNIRKSEFFGTK